MLVKTPTKGGSGGSSKNWVVDGVYYESFQNKYKNEMSLNILLLFLTILLGLWIGGNYFNYLYFRNIYTQKINFLNKKLLNLQEKLIEDYRISCFNKFRISIKGDTEYPPSIYPRFLKNQAYKELIEERKCKLSRLDSNIKDGFKIYIALMIIVVVITFFSHHFVI